MGDKMRVPRLKSQHKDNSMEAKHQEHLRAEILKEEMRHRASERHGKVHKE